MTRAGGNRNPEMIAKEGEKLKKETGLFSLGHLGNLPKKGPIPTERSVKGGTETQRWTQMEGKMKKRNHRSSYWDF